MIHYSNCPVCKGVYISPVFTATDYTVSKAKFEVYRCNGCTAIFTQDVPDETAIGAYYASENYISHSDTREGLVNKLYHAVRKKTLASKKRLLLSETGLQKGSVLDVGCGTGAFLNVMQEAGWKATGLEPDENARIKARDINHIDVLPSAEIYKLPALSYDAITLWHVLEHVHQLHEYVMRLKEMLRPNGRLFIAVPNYTSYDAKVYGAEWAAWDVPRHLYHFSPLSIRTLMDTHGLAVKKIKPMWFDSFYVSMLSEEYKYGKKNIVAAFLKGLYSNFLALLNREKCSSLIYIISRKD